MRLKIWLVLACSACQPAPSRDQEPEEAETDAGDSDDADGGGCIPETEVCNGLDDDCDGAIDEEAADAVLLYTDRDGDGFGAGDAFYACAGPGTASEDGDCDDQDPTAWADVCGDGIRTGCDGDVCRWGSSSSLVLAQLRLSVEDDMGFTSAAGIGDHDGDGLDDVVFGQRNFGEGSGTPTGALHFVAGDLGEPAPDALVVGPDMGNGIKVRAGWRVSRAGDLNSDGFADALAMPAAAPLDAWIVLGPVESGTLPVLGMRAPTGTLDGAGTMSDHNATGVGDVDGDGFDDLLYADSMTDDDTGTAFLARGPIRASPTREAADAVWIGEPSSVFGWRVEYVGDCTGDGLEDVGMMALWPTGDRADFTGGIYIDSAPFTGTRAARDVPVAIFGDATRTPGTDFAGGEDIDGDGYEDLVVGGGTRYDPDYEGPNGDHADMPFAAWVFYGPLTEATTLGDAGAAFQVHHGVEASGAGAGVANPGDMDGDGFGEVAFGLPYAFRDDEMPGAVVIVYGPVEGTHYWDEAGSVLWSEGDYTQPAAPEMIDAAGDYNGDGFADLVVAGRGRDVYNGVWVPSGYVILGGFE